MFAPWEGVPIGKAACANLKFSAHADASADHWGRFTAAYLGLLFLLLASCYQEGSNRSKFRQV